MQTTFYEKNLIINNRELKYKGIFRVDDLFHTINQALKEKQYEKSEKKTEEIVSEAGKKTYLELRPFKMKTNYVIFEIKIKITLDNVTETVEEVHGVKKKFQNGDVSIVFDSWVMTDYENRWTMKPVVYFLKSIINKYLYTFPLEASFPSELASDTAHIFVKIQKLLQSYKYESGKVIKEADVVKEMAKEIVETE